MPEPVRVRRLTDQEGQKLPQIVRRGSTGSVRYRRAMMLLTSAGGNRVPVTAQLVQADEDTVRGCSTGSTRSVCPASTLNRREAVPACSANWTSHAVGQLGQRPAGGTKLDRLGGPQPRSFGNTSVHTVVDQGQACEITRPDRE